MLGDYLIYDENPVHSEAIVVLNTGVEYYPRLIEAADLYNKGFAGKIIINGNRKTDLLRSLEDIGYRSCCPWYEDHLRILELFDVPRKNVIAVDAEDAYDTVSEAEIIGEEIIKRGYKRITITTSKFHTKRAYFIWTNIYKGRLNISIIAAKNDPYNPGEWWKEGRQIRWVLSEYGAWIFYFWRGLIEKRKEELI